MCLGVTAGAYVLTLFAVCASKSQTSDLWVNRKSLSYAEITRILYSLIDEISGEGTRTDAGFPSVQSPIMERMAV
jgi:hypothetical protein